MQSGYRKGGESHWLNRIVFTWNTDPENGANWKGGLRVLAGSHNTDPLGGATMAPVTMSTVSAMPLQRLYIPVIV